ncbi:MAG: exodeoxyribonuclease VII small subunit [Janthinobacterium lividum]
MDTVPDDLTVLSFEAALARLEKIVHRLEAGDAALEESIDLYTEGQRLKAHCEAKLAGATARIEAIQVGADGRAAGLVPFDAG